MNSQGDAFADFASSLIGTPFKLGGRSLVTGIDCVGLIAIALEKMGKTVGTLPRYSLRRNEIAEFEKIARSAGLNQNIGPILRGDILALRPAPAQIHLAICDFIPNIIHAHAGLQKVVRGPLPDWPIAMQWRLS